jgi:hypothetical protein
MCSLQTPLFSLDSEPAMNYIPVGSLSVQAGSDFRAYKALLRSVGPLNKRAML